MLILLIHWRIHVLVRQPSYNLNYMGDSKTPLLVNGGDQPLGKIVQN